jgi:hypothetical protein
MRLARRVEAPHAKKVRAWLGAIAFVVFISVGYLVSNIIFEARSNKFGKEGANAPYDRDYHNYWRQYAGELLKVNTRGNFSNVLHAFFVKLAKTSQ